jgi:hypothetical protein
MYAGVQPADVSSATTAANTVVASLAFTQSSAFASATGGVITANAITSDSSAAGGTVTWGSFLMSNGTTRVVDFSIGVSASDFIINSTTVSTGAAVAASAFTISFAA